MPVNINEPTTWYTEPGAEGDHFELLEQAVAKAMSTPEHQRHPSARIVTKSGRDLWLGRDQGHAEPFSIASGISAV